MDTHAFVWWLTADRRLTARARSAIENLQTPLYVSSVTAFEIATKVRIGKLDVAREIADHFESFVRESGFSALPVRVNHALLAGRIGVPHRDPFDRLLAAQSIIHDLRVITADGAFKAFSVEVVW